jgi:2-keto-4-pentenoate hydratase/2-oxohepta-3-ene-1,7-dioic acid hydratase in catechol pathway
VKLASIDYGRGPTIGFLDQNEELVDLTLVGDDVPTDMRGLLELGPDYVATLKDRASTVKERVAPQSVRFLPLIREPHAVWCAALNYPTHVVEGNWEPPDYPPWFLRVGGSLCGHDEPMVQPIASDRLDYEGELAVIIGSPARHVAEDDAYDVIAGYSCFNDGSVRDWQRHTTQITGGKNFASTGGFGPWLTTRDEVPDVEAEELVTRLNGEVMQRAKVGEMIFGIPKLISYLTTICELLPGDVVVTGTPGGVGARRDPQVFMKPGDVVEVEIGGVGLLRNAIVREATP